MLPEGNPIASLYPQPPPLNQGLASDPLRTLSALSMLNAASEYNARRAMGKAALSNLDPETGLLNVPGFSGAVRNSSDPNMGLAGETAANLAAAQANSQNDLAHSQMMGLMDVAGSFANKDDVTLPEIKQALVDYSTNNHLPSKMYNDVIQDFTASKNLRVTAQKYANMRIGAASTASAMQVNPHTGQPEYTQSGRQSYAGIGGAPVGLPPGGATSIEEPKNQYMADQKQSAILGNNLRWANLVLPLLPLMAQQNFGPKSEGYKTVRATLIQAGVIPADATDTAMFEEVDKLLHQYQSAVRGAGRSDAALAQALGGTPNVNLTKPGLRRTLLNQVAMDKMDIIMPEAFASERPDDMANKSSYLGYRTRFQQQNDPRGFAWDQMTPEEKQEAAKSVGYTQDESGGYSIPPKPGTAHYKDYLKLSHAKWLADQLGQ
jgi:hypothetical protein